MSTPDEKMTPEQKDAMAGELAELRLRAEHGLLKRMVIEVNAGTASSAAVAAEIGRALEGLTALLAIR